MDLNAYQGRACIVREKRNRMSRKGGAVGRGKRIKGRNQRVHLVRRLDVSKDEVKVTLTTLCAYTMGVLAQRMRKAGHGNRPPLKSIAVTKLEGLSTNFLTFRLSTVQNSNTSVSNARHHHANSP